MGDNLAVVFREKFDRLSDVELDESLSVGGSESRFEVG